MGQIILSSSNGCHLDLYAGRHLQPPVRRLWGPGEFLRLCIAEEEFPRIQSIAVGPGAYVQCFQDRQFEGTVIWLLPGQTVDSIADLHFDGELNSIRIYDRPPFAYEPGYSAYMLWAAAHVARPCH